MSACEHCSNADKANWPARCAYIGNWPSREAFVESTFDPPCSLDAYDASMAKQQSRERTFWLVIASLFFWPMIIFILAC